MSSSNRSFTSFVYSRWILLFVLNYFFFTALCSLMLLHTLCFILDKYNEKRKRRQKEKSVLYLFHRSSLNRFSNRIFVFLRYTPFLIVLHTTYLDSHLCVKVKDYEIDFHLHTWSSSNDFPPTYELPSVVHHRLLIYSLTAASLSHLETIDVVLVIYLSS